MNASEKTDKAIKEISSLLQGEYSAHETYGQAIEKAENHTEINILNQIRSEHRLAVASLKEEARKLGEEVDIKGGAWGAFSKAVMGSAKIFGNKAALKALKEGEEHGKNDYEKALNKTELPYTTRELIRDRFLPEQEKHIIEIDRLIEAA